MRRDGLGSMQALGAARHRRTKGWDDLLKLSVHSLLVASSAALLAAMAAFVPMTIFLAQWRDADKPVEGLPQLYAAAVTAFLSAPGPVWLVASGRSATWHLRLAAAYAVENWALRVLLWLNNLQRWRPHIRLWWEGLWGEVRRPTPEELQAEHEEKRAVVDAVIYGLVAAGVIAVIASGVRLAILRLRVLEKSCLVELHAKRLARIFWGEIFLGVLLVAYLFSNVKVVALGAALFAAIGAVAFVGVFTFLHGIWHALRLANTALANAPSERAQQARRTYEALKREFACVVVMASSSLCLALVYAEHYGLVGIVLLSRVELAQQLVELLDALCNEWFALNLSGALSGAVKGTAARAAAARERKRRWRAAEAEWWGRPRSKEWELWDEKVTELAGRGVSLEALLRFFRELKECMPMYEPLKHSTSDVVRGAIVPFSEGTEAACATVLMGGAYTLPDKMVTHNWSNLFLDLVAAILADALGESEFSMISKLLLKDLPRLERWVAHAEVGKKAYWVCAFAVNQHAGICGSIPPDAQDSVTGLRPEPCRCLRAKAWNDTAPLLPDGRGIPCEMNKFDDMMRLLSAADPSFEQVVAVDAEFALFTRAWCGAEIATAAAVGMAQRLKVHSQGAMTERLEQLRSLRIQDMQAARPEDKLEILRSISDVEAFNESLQALLFRDLIPAWTSLDAEERMASAGSVIRWLPVWAADVELDEGGR